MSKYLMGLIISLLLLTAGCSTTNVPSNNDKDVYLDMILKYWHEPNRFVLKEGYYTLYDLLEGKIDSIILDDSSFVNSFMERVISSDRSPVVYDPHVIDGIGYTIHGITYETDILCIDEPVIDVDFIALARTAKKIDTLSFGEFKNYCIIYNDTWFQDSTLFNSLLSIICDTNSMWHKNFVEGTFY